jgi:hypothetical protein
MKQELLALQETHKTYGTGRTDTDMKNQEVLLLHRSDMGVFKNLNFLSYRAAIFVARDKSR